MKYKILALAIFVGISSIVFSNNGKNTAVLGQEESNYLGLTYNTDVSNDTFTKGEMLAFDWNAGNKNSDNNKKTKVEEETDDEDSNEEDLLGENADSEDSDDDEVDDEETEEVDESEEDESEYTYTEKDKKNSGKKRKSHDMSVESGKHGKSHNLLNDAFFYIPEDVVLNDGLLHTENMGFAKKLSGSICVCTFFVSEKNWKNDQYHKLYKQNLEKAEKWLTREAKRYGSTITFENIYPLGDTAITIDKIYGLNETDPNQYGSFLKVLKSMGLTGKEFKKKLRYETACENIVTNFIIDKDGRSYCFLDYKGSKEDDYFDFTWVFKSGWGIAITPGVIAHEMLHAFGAFDLYERDNYRKEQSNTVKKYYPDEIMFTGAYDNIDKAYISPITAWKVGIGEKSKALEFYVPDGWCFD